MKQQLLLLTFILLLTLGCRQAERLDAAPDIVYGQDVCEECSMIINEARFAAAYVTTSGEVRRFDDIGGMLAYDSRSDDVVHLYWVHDLNTEAWVRADQASFVLSHHLLTPMGWGVAAFSAEADAQAYVDENGGELTSFTALQEAVRTGELDPETLHLFSKRTQ